MVSARHPDAIYVGNGQSGGSYVGTPWRIVLHTTETSGMPGYSGGGSAPHVTYDPGSGIFIQHTEFTTAARALANPAGGVQTNRANALQIEIIAYSDKSIADQQPYRQWIGDLTDGQYQELADFLRWLCVDAEIPFVVRLPRPKALYGVSSPSRMSPAAWNAYSGLCGHFEVPENSHWDTGALDILRLVNLIKEGDEDMTPADRALLDNLHAMFNSKSTDAPPWGGSNWADYLNDPWQGPPTSDPGPLNTVTHVQMAKIYATLVAKIKEVSAPGADVEAVIAEIKSRL